MPGNRDVESTQMSLSLSCSQYPQTAAQKTTTVISASEAQQTKQRNAQYACKDARVECAFSLPQWITFSVGGSTLWIGNDFCVCEITVTYTDTPYSIIFQMSVCVF